MITLIRSNSSCVLLVKQTPALKVIFNSDDAVLHIPYNCQPGENPSLSFYPHIYSVLGFQRHLLT